MFSIPITVRPGAVVRVGRRGAAIVDGKIELRGSVGQTLTITARAPDGKLAVQKVALEADGPVPATIDLAR